MSAFLFPIVFVGQYDWPSRDSSTTYFNLHRTSSTRSPHHIYPSSLTSKGSVGYSEPNIYSSFSTFSCSLLTPIAAPGEDNFNYTRETQGSKSVRSFFRMYNLLVTTTSSFYTTGSGSFIKNRMSSMLEGSAGFEYMLGLWRVYCER